jgi:hypothetical protein
MWNVVNIAGMKSGIRSFRPPPDLEQALLAAQAATGSNPSQLMIKAIRRGLPDVVQQLVSQRQVAFNEFEKAMALRDAGPPYKTKKQK